MFKFIWSKELNCFYAEHNPSIRADKNGNVFGGGSTKISGSSEQSSQATPTAEEMELNKLEIERQKAAQSGMMGTQAQGLNLAQLLLQGQGLPGYLSSLPGGMSQAQQITPEEATLDEPYIQDITRETMRGLFPQFQAMGLPIESGVAQSIAGRTAGDIRRGVAETNIGRQMGAKQFNIETEASRQGFNMGQLLNLLNLAVGGQAQIQQPILSGGATLSQQLAGLRSISGTGSMRQRTSGGVSLGILGRWGG